MNLTLANALTPEGIVAAAALITTIVALIKNVFSRYVPALDQNGALMAFVLAAVLYVLVAIATGADGTESLFAVFVSFIACATSAVGVNATIRTTQTGTP